jgi:hypothetical protein
MYPTHVAGQRPVADELFQLAHDEYTGQSYISREVLGVGLAGAALIELTWADKIAIKPGAVVERTAQHFTGDPVGDHVLQQIAGQEPHTHPVTQWVNFMRDDLYTVVAERLTRANILRVTRGGMLRQTRYEAVDPFTYSMPRSRLVGTLQSPPPRHQALDERNAVLAGLTVALDLWAAVSVLSADEVREQAAKVTTRLPADMNMIMQGVADAKMGLTQRPRR